MLNHFGSVVYVLEFMVTVGGMVEGVVVGDDSVGVLGRGDEVVAAFGNKKWIS